MASRLAKAARRSAEAIALAVVFGGATTTAVALHSNTGAVRRVVQAQVNARLADLFQGTIAVRRLDELSIGGTTSVRANVEILDADGHRAIALDGVDIALDSGELVSSLRSGGAPSLRFPRAKVDTIELVLDVDAEKQPKLARTFAAKHPKPPEPPRAAVDVPESIRLLVPSLAVRRIHVRGDLAPPPGIDADLEKLEAKIAIAENVLRIEPLTTEVTVRAPSAPTQSGPARGAVSGGIAIPLAGGEPKVVLDWKGDTAGIPFTAHVGLQGSRIDATLDVPKAAPEAITKAFPIAPVTKPVDVHVVVGGDLSTRLVVDATAHAGDGEIRAKGSLGMQDRMAFTLDADLDRVDAAALTGPVSAITARAHAEGTLGGGKPTGTFRLDSKEGTAAGTPTPVVVAEGSFDPERVQAKVHAHEGSLDVRASVDMDLPKKRLSFDAIARAPDLASLRRAPGLVGGSATAHATGTIDLETKTIAGRVVADASGITKAPAKVGHVHAEASLSGPLEAPSMNVTADASDVVLQAPGKDPLAYPSAKARARVSLAPHPRIVDAEVVVTGPEQGTSIVASASEIELPNGNVVVKGGKVTGLGSAVEVEVRTTRGGGVVLRARADDIDLERARQMTGIRELELLPKGSRASLDVDLENGATGVSGHVDLAVKAEDGSVAEVHATLTGKHVSGRARVASPELGFLEVSRAELDLPGPPSARAFERATGTLDLRGEIDLGRGAALFAGDAVREIHGTALISARVERGSPTTLPFVAATVRTRGLDVTFENESGAPTRIAGIDVSAHVSHDAATDDTEVGLLAWNGDGVLASAELQSRVPVVAWATGRERFDRDALGALAISGAVDVAERRVETLPIAALRRDLEGTIAAHVEASGTVAHPLVTLAARASDLAERKRPATGAQGATTYAPFDGALDARWDGENVVVSLALDEEEKSRRNAAAKTSGSVRALVLGRVRADDLLHGRALDWNASAELDVRALELAPLPLPMSLRGALTTHASLRDLAGEPSLGLRAHIDELGVSGARLAAGDLEADVKSGVIDATAQVKQDDGGTAKVVVHSRAVTWRGIDFAYDPTRPARVRYEVDRLRLSILRPIVRRSIPEIDGLLVGKGSATVDASSQVFEGGLALQGGRMYVNALGDEITDLTATASFERNGVFRIADVRGKVNAGVITAAAAGRMRGLGLDAAEIVVLVPSKDGIPLSSEGATFAEANGEVKIAVRMAPDRRALTADVTLSHARIEVPDRGTQNLQPLEPDETIAFGIRKPDGTLAPAPLRPPSNRQQLTEAGASEPLAARLTVTLGEEVTLEGRGLRLTLTGRTVVDIAREIAVTGQIDLKQGGTIDVQGRKFVVDRGIVTFGGKDPADPTVIAAAYWDAPDRTRVWVEFQGPLKTGKLSLRSEPPYTKNEILSILLFGRPDPNQTTADTKANQVTGAAATAGLNKALGELSDDIDLEQDQTSANRLRTKLGYRIRRNLKVQLGYAATPSQREPDTTYLFLEWQFAPKWSLLGTRGDRGTSILDMLWQYRY
ncbi:MAG: translocation/assembly module TamB domain-containing protein [Deltaproteobacteria bacterium]|nr:translocation/assembly module TamB domain-containing protein [Deltaproteobacteria bacterium]